MFLVFLHRIDTPSVTDPYLVGVTDLKARSFRQSIRLALQFSRQPFIIGIEESEPIAAGLLYPSIPCGTDAAVFLPDVTRFRELAGQGFGRAVNRAIINNEDFVW